MNRLTEKPYFSQIYEREETPSQQEKEGRKGEEKLRGVQKNNVPFNKIKTSEMNLSEEERERKENEEKRDTARKKKGKSQKFTYVHNKTNHGRPAAESI